MTRRPTAPFAIAARHAADAAPAARAPGATVASRGAGSLLALMLTLGTLFGVHQLARPPQASVQFAQADAASAIQLVVKDPRTWLA